MMKHYGGIEAGGTKFICVVGSGPQEILAETRFPTTTPEETIGKAIAFFREQAGLVGGLAGLGVAAFGPVDLNRNSATYGYITATPKPGWANTNLVGALQAALHLPVAFDTDVNGAALAEWRWGAGQGLSNLIYLTIGTGVGGGAIVGGQLVHGLVHPEMGHILLPHDRTRDPFEGACPFHRDCFEGLAAGPALEKRWGARAETFTPDHPAWALEAHYIAQALMSYTLCFSPERIILGGGVMAQQHLFPMIRRELQTLLNGYVQHPALTGPQIEQYVVPPGLGGKAGMFGALALGQE
jgi:fructokinase